MHVNLQCSGYQGKTFPFEVELLDHALDHLIGDTRNAYRIYELFCIRRPGDIWKYLWVRLLDVPEQVWERYRRAKKQKEAEHPPCLWPENTLPLRLFDLFFFWCWDDTKPEDECWLRARQGDAFREWLTSLYVRITQAQEVLRESDDPLIQHEIQAIYSVRHPYDYDDDRPFLLTSDRYESPVISKRSVGYYDKLRELLILPEVQSVACRGADDFQTLRLICTEQRKQAKAVGKQPKDVLPISVLADGVAFTKAWQAWIRFYQEGLGYSDLWVEQQRLGASIKDLVEKHERRRFLFFLYEDQGEIQGYQRTFGNGWFLYRDQDPDMDYRGISQAYYERFTD